MPVDLVMFFLKMVKVPNIQMFSTNISLSNDSNLSISLKSSVGPIMSL